MPLETVSYISDLVITNPDGADQRSTADDHLRNIKKAITQTFPNIAGQVSVSHGELNRLDGISANIETRLDALTASLSALNTTVNNHGAGITTHDRSVSALNTTISGMTTTLDAHTASISAINTTISGMTTTLNNYGASLSELSTNVIRANPSGFNQTVYYALFSTSDINTGLKFGPAGWSATISTTAGRRGFVVTHGLNFNFSASGVMLGAFWMQTDGYEQPIAKFKARDDNSIYLDTSDSVWTSSKLKFSFIRK